MVKWVPILIVASIIIWFSVVTPYVVYVLSCYIAVPRIAWVAIVVVVRVFVVTIIRVPLFLNRSIVIVFISMSVGVNTFIICQVAVSLEACEGFFLLLSE